MPLKQNVVANYLGQGWRVFMSLIFVPVYVKYLGIEAYGLIGMFVLLQVWLGLLDLGLRPVLVREMARFTGGGASAEYIKDLQRSVELIAICISVLIGLGVWLASGWLAKNWVQLDELPVDVVSNAFALMGVVSALRFLESIYTSSLAGLQRQVLQNWISSILATVRGFGAVIILMFVSPTIEAFFVWQGFVSILTLFVFIYFVYRILPPTSRPARFSKGALQNVWRFSAGMLSISLLVLLLTQTDKILLSRLIPLTEFGYYVFAAAVAGGLYSIVNPIAAAFYPRFTELVTQENGRDLVKTYHLGSQLVTVLMGSTALMLITFADRILLLWTADPALTEQAAPIVSVLALGVFLNGLMWMPYQMQLAYGWTSLTIKINTVAVLLFVPAILWVVPIYGVLGAAWIWVTLNLGYCFIGIHFMHYRILRQEKWEWYSRDILVPILAAAISLLLVKLLMPSNLNWISEFGVLLASSIFVLLISVFAAPLVRENLNKTTLVLINSIISKNSK